MCPLQQQLQKLLQHAALCPMTHPAPLQPMPLLPSGGGARLPGLSASAGGGAASPAPLAGPHREAGRRAWPIASRGGGKRRQEASWQGLLQRQQPAGLSKGLRAMRYSRFVTGLVEFDTLCLWSRYSSIPALIPTSLNLIL